MHPDPPADSGDPRSRGGLLRRGPLPPVHRRQHALPGHGQPAEGAQRGGQGRHLGLPAGLPEGGGGAQRDARHLQQDPHEEDDHVKGRLRRCPDL